MREAFRQMVAGQLSTPGATFAIRATGARAG